MAKTKRTIRRTGAGLRARPVAAQTLVLAGKQFVVLEREEYEQLRAAAEHCERDLPPLPTPDAEGNVEALSYTRVLLARKIILARKGKGWTQKQLADGAGVRIETINRIENGHNMPDVATVEKIQAAIDKS